MTKDKLRIPMIFRTMLIMTALQLVLPCHSEDLSSVKMFAKGFVSAIKTKDEKVIFTELYPDTFTGIPTEQVAFVKKHWMEQFCKDADWLTEPMWINIKRLEGSNKILPQWRWCIQPEYQIEIQPYKETNGGQETTGFGLTETAVFKDGRYYIVRPIPPEQTIAAAMGKSQASAPASEPPQPSPRR